MTEEEFLEQVDAAVASKNITRLQELGQYVKTDITQSTSFTPGIYIDDPSRDAMFEGVFKLGVRAANHWARALRELTYDVVKLSGYTGPIIVDEGDSWFQYPVLDTVLTDTIDVLSQEYAVKSLSAASDTLDNILKHNEYSKTIKDEDADVFLFSAAGNDIIGEGNFAKLLRNYKLGMSALDVLKQANVEAALDKIIIGYELMIKNAQAAKLGIHIFFHGYDVPIPRIEGKALGIPMAKKKIPVKLQTEILTILINKLNHRLIALAKQHERVTHIDCRGVIGNSVEDWYDEIHPSSQGYQRVANLFRGAIQAINLKS